MHRICKFIQHVNSEYEIGSFPGRNSNAPYSKRTVITTQSEWSWRWKVLSSKSERSCHQKVNGPIDEKRTFFNLNWKVHFHATVNLKYRPFSSLSTSIMTWKFRPFPGVNISVQIIFIIWSKNRENPQFSRHYGP